MRYYSSGTVVLLACVNMQHPQCHAESHLPWLSFRIKTRWQMANRSRVYVAESISDSRVEKYDQHLTKLLVRSAPL
jgi:hypothetical protein